MNKLLKKHSLVRKCFKHLQLSCFVWNKNYSLLILEFLKGKKFLRFLRLFINDCYTETEKKSMWCYIHTDLNKKFSF